MTNINTIQYAYEFWENGQTQYSSLYNSNESNFIEFIEGNKGSFATLRIGGEEIRQEYEYLTSNNL